MKLISFVLLVLLPLIQSCSTLVGKSEVGQCWRHKWESGLWLVKKVDEEQVIIEQIPEHEKDPIIGKIKVIGPWYGGWYLSHCPKNYQDWSKQKKELENLN